MPLLLRWIAAFLLLAFLVVTVLIANFTQMLTLLLLPLSPRLFREANRFISGHWFGLLSWVLRVLGVEIIQTGDKIPMRENAVLVANHQAMADIPVLVSFSRRYGRAGDLKWFVKDPIKWVPGIGWGMQFLDCLFVKRNWMADKEKVTATFAKIRAHQSPFWVVSFLEGTRLTPAKKLRSQEYAAKRGLPKLEHVMLPRSKGFEATLAGLGDLNQAIYVATIGYEGSAPGLFSLFFGPTRRIHLHVRRYPVWPTSEQAAWILERYQEKDQLLASFKQRLSF